MAERELAITFMNMNVSDLCMCACVLQVRDRHVQELQTEILNKDQQLQQLRDENDRNTQQKDRQLQHIRDEKDRNIQQKDQQLRQKDRLFQQLRDENDRNIQQKEQEKNRQMEVELCVFMGTMQYLICTCRSCVLTCN